MQSDNESASVERSTEGPNSIPPAAHKSSPVLRAAKWLKCPRCNYDLRGLSKFLCPECGETFDPMELRRQYYRQNYDQTLHNEIFGAEYRIVGRFIYWFFLLLFGCVLLSYAIKKAFFFGQTATFIDYCMKGKNKAYSLAVVELPVIITAILTLLLLLKCVKQLYEVRLKRPTWSAIFLGLTLLIPLLMLRGCTKGMAHFD